MKKKEIIGRILEKLDIHPVLFDVGASGDVPKIWEDIALRSVFVGFDPDEREMKEASGGGYFKKVIMNKAVTEQKIDKVKFYLTKSPYCSSTLMPDEKALSDYAFSGLFAVERTCEVDALTLDDVIKRTGVGRIDWLKVDTQGTDLRIYRSVKDDVRSKILAVDVEPGLIDAYREEDLFVDAQKHLLSEGFWLSDIKVNGAVRIKETTVTKLNIKPATLNAVIKKSPGWCEARYLRTCEWMKRQGCGKEEHILLWCFALMDDQIGFSMDVAGQYVDLFGKDDTSGAMMSYSSDEIKKNVRGVRLMALKKKILSLFKGK